jgi:cohesin complex subunit SA-1/2
LSGVYSSSASVFVHRYRDTDWAIRVECIRALGLWFQKHPGHFLDGSYLRYVGWVFSDDNMHVRLEAVKSLAGAYEQEDHISSLQTFTERFKPRMIQMATGDTETSVRVSVIQVLGAIDSHSLLEDEQRETLCLLVFDEDPRVRKAVSNFVKGVWEDAVEERLVGRKASLLGRKRAGIKALATLLVRWGTSLDGLTIGYEEDDEDGHGEGSSQVKPLKEVVLVMDPQKKGRTALAVEVLWNEINPISDWENLLDILLLDHSASSGEDEGSLTQTPRRTGNHSVDESKVDDAWRLEEVEEAMVLEVFVASIKKALAEAAGGKKVVIFIPTGWSPMLTIF